MGYLPGVRMRAIGFAVVIMVMLGISLAPGALAQGQLVVQLTEDPFVCDGGSRSLGVVSGFEPDEAVVFTSPQIRSGLPFSTRTAEADGSVAMRWSCDEVKSWEVTVTGIASRRTVTFFVTGKTAPPPPDAPLGAAFDAKSAMTIGEMAIWKDVSPYNGVGIYIPVNREWDNRADKDQVNLTPAWVDAVLADGWRILPIYVGWQAPTSCTTGNFYDMSGDAATARTQGLTSAADAVQSMAGLGIEPGAPIYYDMEGYRPGCGRVVMSFLEGWTEGVRAAGYLSGVYGSQNSVMTDLTAAALRGAYTTPDAIWVSSNSGVATALGLDFPPDELWTNARIHQYRLSVTRTYGGVTREVDDNIVAGPAATFRPVAIDDDGDGHAEPEPDNCDSIANPDQADLDGDGDGDACDPDIDGDGVTDPEPDNCDREPNPDQADLDGDGDGDVCDPDIDGDLIANADDPAPSDPTIPAPAPTATPEAPPATATPIPQPTEAPTPSEVAEPAPTATPSPVPTLAAAIALPTPTATPSPVPTATPTPGVAPEPAAPPSSSGELETAQMTIEQADDDSNLWNVLAIVGSAALAIGFGGMAVRSWRTRHW